MSSLNSVIELIDNLSNIFGKWGRESQAAGVNVLRDQIEIRASAWDLNLRCLEDRVAQSPGILM